MPWRFRSKSALWKYLGMGLERQRSGKGPDTKARAKNRGRQKGEIQERDKVTRTHTVLAEARKFWWLQRPKVAPPKRTGFSRADPHHSCSSKIARERSFRAGKQLAAGAGYEFWSVFRIRK
jgi:hypothetical protein